VCGGHELTRFRLRTTLSSRRYSHALFTQSFHSVETGNAAIADGTLSKTMDSILSDLKPEAAYFAEDNGKRTGFIFFDLKDTSQIPAVAEPWFLAFDAHLEFHPAMNLEDLKNAAPGIERAVKHYRRTSHAKAA
jgi:hypothetical protein